MRAGLFQKAAALGIIGALVAALLLAACLYESAYATYADTREPEPSAENYPENGGNFQPNGDVLSVSSIPDGVYEIPTVTSSRMCRFFSSKSGADAGGAPSKNPYSEKSILVVEGGAATAVFYVSSAYSRLYMGTAEEAAALAEVDEDGVVSESSAYMRSEPESERVYTIAVGALNSPITFSSYNGGRSVSSGTWMTRQVIFQTSDEVLAAIEQANNPDPEDPGSDDPGSGDADDKEPSSPDSGDPSDQPSLPAEEAEDPNEDAGDYDLPDLDIPDEGTDDPDDSEDPDKESKDPGKEGDDPGKKGEVSSSASAQPGSVDEQTAPSAEDGEGENPEAGNGEDESGGTESVAAKKRGVLISPAALEKPEVEVEVVEAEEPEPEDQGLSREAASGMALGVVVLAGIAWRTVSFALARRKPTDL